MGVCDWPVSYAECGPCTALTDLTEEQRAVFETMAAEYLWRWTGRAFGTCPVTVRPCRKDCSSYSTFWGGSQIASPVSGGGAPWTPVLVGGHWYNITCAQCGSACRCDGGAASIWLPGPIDSVTEVLVDGTPLDESAYRVDNHTWLVRTDGQVWPSCQDLISPSTEVGTWEVTYNRGAPVPAGGQMAAGKLACELAKAACGDEECELPQRVQTITRQGVTVAMLDAFDDIDKGHTGIWLIDSWIASITQPKQGGSVYSVDVPRPRVRRQTWPVT